MSNGKLKISDFGLSVGINTNERILIKKEGTIGYIAPELDVE